MTGYAVKHSIRAEDIRILRKKLKLTQKDFAKLVNVSQKTIERWESENRDITGPVTTLVHSFKRVSSDRGKPPRAGKRISDTLMVHV